jgi:hypothetical protein
MSLEENIKKWVSLDNQLKTLTEKTKELRDARSTTEELILDYVETKQMNNATVNISDGRLRFVSTKQTAPLTLKYVEECLMQCIGNEEKVEKLMDYIKEKREVKYVPDIKRTYNNN